MPRRTYDQYCAVARALDRVGDRWTLLIVRELLAGPRRYTDLHADLPGVSTDVLASRLKDMEKDGLAARRRLPAPSASTVYELTERGRELTPVLAALAGWGAAELAGRGPTDAVRAHWFAIPLLRRLADAAAPRTGVAEVKVDEGVFHLRLTADGPSYGDGPAQRPDARLVMRTDTCVALVQGRLTVPEALAAGAVEITGEGALAGAFRSPAAAGSR
ncbi:winged helix-turn-helix transcriptional regulator [Streptomyces sp. TRM 70361]|uniref:winged helix-turn-helix transcriptional regulator n=1 Tax=Streptomyces sp. TRM 70361 TaxID=3116553 RepID=UPI002E7BBD7F|nr:winged helix-turn-helix transcriptional regulator [Streptomyces sp. TRM 70361]MEE1942330.1 winged helix-turn-helix transcriptional regulator [Streptomyces sp. TRM 70361]